MVKSHTNSFFRKQWQLNPFSAYALNWGTKIIAIVLLTVFASCKQSAFIKRKYTKGHYFEGITKLKTKPHEPECNNSKKLAQLQLNSINNVFIPDCGDTIITNNGRIVPCKVMSIDQNRVSYETCNNRGGILSDMPNHTIKHIRFQNGKREYFSKEHSLANPLLLENINNNEYQKNLSSNPPVNKSIGFALFGYSIPLLIGMITLITVPVLGILMLGLSFLGIIGLFSKNQNSGKFNAARNVGRALGVITISVFLFALFIIIVAIMLI